MDKHNNLNILSSEELIQLCSKTVELHESIKNRIVELTLELESRTDDLHNLEHDWAQIIDELNKRNSNV